MATQCQDSRDGNGLLVRCLSAAYVGARQGVRGWQDSASRLGVVANVVAISGKLGIG